MTINHLMAEQFRRDGGAAAVRLGDRVWTRGELDRAADAVASALRGHGAAAGEAIVAVYLERSFELVATLVGILRAGAAWLPLDPEDPPARTADLLADAAPAALLTTAALQARVGDAVPILTVDDLPPAAPAPLPELADDHLAYVIYTSGSTGAPKGAMNTHGALRNRLVWMQDRYGIGTGDVVLQKTPATFDVSLWEFLWPLMSGAELVLARPGGHRDAGYLARLIADRGVTVVHFVPSMLRRFLDVPDVGTLAAPLRHLICSGEALTPALRDVTFARLPDVALHNLYGPTEAAIDVTHWTCARDDRTDVVPIGHPVANTQIHLLDDHLAPVTDGETGELCIGGIQVARGYLNRLELTAERFIPDPFAGDDAARLYRTGDLARRRPDGAVEFLGRRDDQVKVRGFRIELGEIAAALERHPAVREAAVIVRDDPTGEPLLVAYVTGGNDVTGPALRAALAERLPAYMVPARIIPLATLPLTSSGKVDRRALPAPGRDRPDLDEPYAPPRTPLERAIAERWQAVLGLDRVGRHDRFFELGGTSLQAARFVNDLHRDLGEFVYVTTVFEAPTVAAYADLLSRDYADAVTRRFGTNGGERGGPRHTAATRVDDDALSRLAAAVHPRAAAEGAPDTRNPPAVFILAPPRSGTTLLRVMLAGHPRLFAAAELQLLGFRTLRERRDAFRGRHAVWLDGAVRAVMELLDTGPEGAEAFIADCEARNLSTQAFYRELQDRLENRMLVDKSPSYAMDPGTLRAAEREFTGARYLQLVRHPWAMATSFERYHMDQVLHLRERPLTGRLLGEAVWTLSHRTVNDFLHGVPADRWARIRFEDLVREPASTMRRACTALGVPFDEAVLHPYADLDTKMTDGVHPESTPMGDTHFLERRRIDPAVADAWRGVLADDFLGEPTWALAEAFGYRRPDASTAADGSSGRNALAARRERTARRRSAS